MSKLLLLDTASMYYRAYHSMPETMVSKDGTPVNAVRGLLERIIKLKIERKPDLIIAAWDTEWRPQWRVDLIPSYKTHRLDQTDESNEQDEASSMMPDSLGVQIPIIEELLIALGIPVIGHEEYEADDVIGTYAQNTQFSNTEIVTGDRDLFQLIDNKRDVSVLYTSKGNLEHYREQQVLDKYGVRADQYVDYAILRGDPSDGLPGVKGVGDKTAAKLISQFGDLDSVIKEAENRNSEIRERIAVSIVNTKDYLEKAKKVVPVVKNVDIPPINKVKIGVAPTELLIRTAEDLNLKTVILKALNTFSIS
jgi:5'-3' exonuclease